MYEFYYRRYNLNFYVYLLFVVQIAFCVPNALNMKYCATRMVNGRLSNASDVAHSTFSTESNKTANG